MGAGEKAASAAAGAGGEWFFELIANGARDLLKTVSTFWMEVPSPEVASGSGQSWSGSPAIMSVQSWLSPVAFVIFLVSLGFALLKIAHDSRRAGEGFNAILRSLVTTLAGGLPLLAITMLLIQFGDEFSPWVLEKASGEDVSGGFASIFVDAMMGSASGTPAASGGLLIIYLLAILGSIMQVIFMVVRGAALIVLLAFAQVVAAGTATEEGWLRFKRIAMLVVAFALYKPVAAVIYGVGLKLMSEGASTSEQLINSIYALTIIVMAALALPSVIKFVAPAAALGSSAAFSGGAALGGLAAGASMVALAGAGGGAMAAAGAGGGSGAGRMASMSSPSGPPGGSGGTPGANPAGPPPDDGSSGNQGSAGDSGADGKSGSGAEVTGDQSTPGTGSSGGRSPAGAGGGGDGATPVDSGQSPAQGSSTTSSSAAARAGQTGATTVQNLTGQIGKAGDDASADENQGGS